tara:strand:+ start:4971 stop:5660 length:690 start_codon:yes stop_codon:yes gene_type:complete
MSRFAELDFFRGSAILSMIIYHVFFQLWFFGIYSGDVLSGWWYIFARSIAITFLLLVGISIVLSYHNRKSNFRNLYRGKIVLLSALAVSLVTFLTFSEYAIYFGVLHFIALMLLLSPLMVRLKVYPLAFLSIFSIMIGFWFKKLIVESEYLFWTGLKSSAFKTFDYFPIFPWIGVVLLGVLLGKVYYRNAKSLDFFNFKVLNWFSRNSLLIYLIHNPLIYGLIRLVFQI